VADPNFDKHVGSNTYLKENLRLRFLRDFRFRIQLQFGVAQQAALAEG